MYIREISRIHTLSIAGVKCMSRRCFVWPVPGSYMGTRTPLMESYGRSRSMSTWKPTHIGMPDKDDVPKASVGSVNSREDGYAQTVTDDCDDHIIAKVKEYNGDSKGILQELLPVELMRDTLIAIHDTTGLTWAGTITACTLFLKVCFIPVWAMGERARRNNAHLLPIAVELQEKLKEAQKTGDTKMAMQIQRTLYKQMTRKTFIKGAVLQVGAASIQGITFAWVYGGLKMFAIEPMYCPGFTLEKNIWLESLALPDPYYAFPLTLWALMTLVYELNQRIAEQMRLSSGAISTVMQEQETRQQKMKYFTRAAIAMFAYFSCTMTSGTFFYLVPSFLFQAILRYVSRRGIVATLLRLPTPIVQPIEKTESPTFQRVRDMRL